MYGSHHLYQKYVFLGKGLDKQKIKIHGMNSSTKIIKTG